jgi:hypothetical protein
LGSVSVWRVGYGGAVFGWLAGTPFDKKDQERFSRITSALSLVVSGFLLAKLEPSVAAVFGDGRLLDYPLYGVRLLNIAINFVATAITVYLDRLDGSGHLAGQAHHPPHG